MNSLLKKSALRLIGSCVIIYTLGYMFVGASNLVHQASAEASFKLHTTADFSNCTLKDAAAKERCNEIANNVKTVNQTETFTNYATSAIFNKPFFSITKDDMKEEFINKMTYIKHVAGAHDKADEMVNRIKDDVSKMIDLEFETKRTFIKPKTVLKSGVYWFILISSVIAIMSLLLTVLKPEDEVEFSGTLVKNLNMMYDRWFFIMFAVIFAVQVHVNSIF